MMLSRIRTLSVGFARDVAQLEALAAGVEAQSAKLVPFTLVAVSCAPIQQALLDTAAALRAKLMAGLAAAAKDQNEYVCERYADIQVHLKADAEDPEALDALRQYLQASQAELRVLEANIRESQAVFQVLHHAKAEISEAEASLLWATTHCPQVITNVVRDSEAQQQAGRVRFMDELRRDKAKLVDDLEDIATVVTSFTELGEIEAVEERVAYCQDIEARITVAREQAELYNAREELFQQKPTEYPQVAAIMKEFEPSNNLWKTCADFMRAYPQWMNGPFPTLDAEAMANDVDKWFRSTAKMQKQLTGAPLVVASALYDKISAFQQHIPLITALRNPGLRDRHWTQMSERIGFPVKADASFSVTRALHLELQNHLVTIEEVSEYASKEFSLERTLDKMQADWNGVVFDYMAWRDTGTYILKGLDDTQMLLDDQIVKTQSMRSSPYIGPFEERVRIWENKLVLLQEMMDEWLKCQQGWLYLEPIFGSEDIMQQMPTEGRKFRVVSEP